MPNNTINAAVQKCRFALLLDASYGERYCYRVENRFKAVRFRRRTFARGRSATVGIRPKAEVHGRPLRETGLTPIRIITRD
jgi:hypothetical protein